MIFPVSNCADYIRSRSTPSRLSIGPARLGPKPIGCICAGPAPHSDPAMCVLGQFGDSNGHMEGRAGDCRSSPRKQRGGLCAGVPEDLARGSH